MRYDCRHYVRLFRRLLHSDVLKDFNNIANDYYALHALLLKPGESFAPETAFVYNLFDNDDSDTPGNALIRYRVLEYFLSNTECRELFDTYFRALGPGPRIARAIAASYDGAGLIIPIQVVGPTTAETTGYRITHAGRRVIELARSLWHGICVKTGMYIYDYMIKRNDEAKREAEATIGKGFPGLIEFYATHGWVSDDDFIDFLYKQEELEDRRIGDYQLNHPETAQQIASLLETRGSIADILNAEYAIQRYAWKRS